VSVQCRNDSETVGFNPYGTRDRHLLARLARGKGRSDEGEGRRRQRYKGRKLALAFGCPSDFRAWIEGLRPIEAERAATTLT
jgi:hypothetical protein